MTALIVGALIAVAAAVIVALPFLRDPAGRDDVIAHATPRASGGLR